MAEEMQHDIWDMVKASNCAWCGKPLVVVGEAYGDMVAGGPWCCSLECFDSYQEKVGKR